MIDAREGDDIGELFGELRAALTREPDWAVWCEVCAIIELAAELNAARVNEQWTPYLDGALRRWPDALRVCPPRWLEPDRSKLSTLARVVWLPRRVSSVRASRLAMRWAAQPRLRGVALGERPPTWRALDATQLTLIEDVPPDARTPITRWLQTLTDPLATTTRHTLDTALHTPPVWRALREHLPPLQRAEILVKSSYGAIPTASLRQLLARDARIRIHTLITPGPPWRADRGRDRSQSAGILELEGQWLDALLNSEHETLRALVLGDAHALEPQHIPATHGAPPLDLLDLGGCGTAQLGAPVRAILNHPRCAKLRALGLAQRLMEHTPDTLIDDLVDAPCVETLRVLNLRRCALGRYDVMMLASAGLLRSDVSLDLSGCQLNNAALYALLTRGDWSRGFPVRLDGSRFTERGRGLLRELWHDHPPTHLNLCSSGLNAMSLTDLASAGGLRRVHTLDLSYLNLRGLDLDVLAQHTPALRRLGLIHAALDPDALTSMSALSRARWARLETLYLERDTGLTTPAHIAEEDALTRRGFRVDRAQNVLPWSQNALNPCTSTLDAWRQLDAREPRA